MINSKVSLDSDYHNRVFDQINQLNQQSIQVRRPSDLSNSYPSQTSSMQNCYSRKQEESPKKPLNQISEEMSLKEQSLRLHESLISKKKSPKIHIQLGEADMIEEKLLCSQYNAIQWEQLYTDSHIVGEKKILNDNLIVPITQKASSLWPIAIDLIYICQFLVFMTFILIGVAQTNYKQIYQLQFQIPLLLLNTCIVKDRQYILLISGNCIPFFIAMVDRGDKVIGFQLLYLLNIVQVYKKSEQLYLILHRHYILYYLVKKILEIHSVNVILAFFSLLVINEPSQDISEILVKYSVINLAFIEYESFFIYIIKILSLLYILYLIGNATIEYSIIAQEQNILKKYLLQFSKAISDVEFQLSYKAFYQEYLSGRNKLKLTTLTDSVDTINKQHIDEIFKSKYEIIKKMTAFNFSQKTFQKIYQSIQERIIFPNETIIMEQQFHKSLFYIVEGEVIVQQSQFDLQILQKEEFFNQGGFFLNQASNVTFRAKKYTKLYEIPYDQLIQSLKPQELEHMKQIQYLAQFQDDYENILLKCYACGQPHPMEKCKQFHYVCSRKVLIDYIHYECYNERSKQFRKQRRFNGLANRYKNERAAIDHRIAMYQSSDISKHENPHLMEVDLGLSPVQQINQKDSSQSSLQINKESSKLKDSFQIHRQRITNQRIFSVVPSQSEKHEGPIQKYQTVFERSSKKSLSYVSEMNNNNDPILQALRNPSLVDDRQFSRHGIASSKFTGETSKQFVQIDMPLYDVFENQHQFSDYFPNHNMENAIENYRQYQDSIISSNNKYQTSIMDKHNAS